MKTRRLGERFEANLFSLIETHPDVEGFRSNVLIGKIGEADALFRLKQDPSRLYHLETAVKFYLCLQSQGSLDAADFVGPELKDSLAKKLKRIETHQLKILDNTDWSGALSEAWVTGILFYPYQDGIKLSHRFSHPKAIEKNHAQGLWVHHQDFEALYRSIGAKQGAFFETKSDWIRSRTPQDLVEVTDLSLRIDEYFTTTSRPHQCELQSARGEVIRIFVVPDSWPTETVDPSNAIG